METMGLDVSHKIRSAIKAKLVELGAYVDEELPDYIMVMVANKKTKAQMTEDLALFLGTNTEKFTSWLHEVLERLQSVTSESKKKAELKGKEKGGDRKRDAVAKVASIPPAEETKTKVDKPIHSEPPKDAEETKGSDVDDNQEEVLAIKADFEADELLAEELRDDVAKGSTIERGRRQNVVMPMQRTVVSHAETSGKPASSAKPATTEDSGRKRPMPTVEQHPTAAKHRLLSSAVRSTPVAHPQPEAEDDDDDDNYKHNKTLSSIIKISERRPTLPPTLQANKMLILKAMEEAKKSVIAAAQKVPAVKVEPYSTVVVEAKAHGKRKTPQGAAAATAVVSLDTSGDKQEELMEIDVSELRSNTVVPPAREEPLAAADTRKYVMTTGDAAVPADANRIVQENRQDDQLSNTEFIVTLDGMEPESLLHNQKTSILRGVRSTDFDVVEEIAPMAIDFDDDMHESSQQLAVLRTLAQTTKVKERCKYWPACKNGDACPYHHPSVQCKTFPRCKYGEKCLYIHPNCMFDAACSRKDCPYTHASKRLLVGQPALPKPRVATNPKNVRCKFFPQCTNMDCSYFHPKACRYGLSCKKPGCVYSHPQLPSPEKLRWTSGQPEREKNMEVDQKAT